MVADVSAWEHGAGCACTPRCRVAHGLVVHAASAPTVVVVTRLPACKPARRLFAYASHRPIIPLITPPPFGRLFLIRHMDDLDDIYGVLLRLGDMKRKVPKPEFARLLTEALGRDRALSSTSIGLLYKMYCNQAKDELQVGGGWGGGRLGQAGWHVQQCGVGVVSMVGAYCRCCRWPLPRQGVYGCVHQAHCCSCISCILPSVACC